MTEAEFLDLVSGKRRGAAAEIARLGLLVASGFYGIGSTAKNLAYDLGVLPQKQGRLPVISVGNITTGGTGKTPFAAWLARWYRDQGVRVCFVSRGYKAEPGRQNDEALVLDQLCPDVPHLQNPDRFAAVEVAKAELDSQLVILDDGFQHRRLARDLDIVLIDALNPFGYGHWLPRGLMRESRYALKRADVIVVTRVDQAERDALAQIVKVVKSVNHEAVLVEASFPPLGLISSTGRTAPLGQLHGQTVAGFCGIGNPAAFESSLRLAGSRLLAFRRFPDHHAYDKADVDDLAHWIKDLSPALVATTQKDLVKLDIDSLGGRPLWGVEIGTQLQRGEAELNARLRQVLQKVPRDD